MVLADDLHPLSPACLCCQLPDGREIKVGRERFETTEALFEPSLVDVETAGISNLVFDLIQVRSGAKSSGRALTAPLCHTWSPTLSLPTPPPGG